MTGGWFINIECIPALFKPKDSSNGYFGRSSSSNGRTCIVSSQYHNLHRYIWFLPKPRNGTMSELSRSLLHSNQNWSRRTKRLDKGSRQWAFRKLLGWDTSSDYPWTNYQIERAMAEIFTSATQPLWQSGWRSHSATQSLRVAEWLSGCSSHSGRVAAPATLAEWLSGWVAAPVTLAEWLSGWVAAPATLAEWLSGWVAPPATPAEWLSGWVAAPATLAEWLSGCISHSGTAAEWLSGCGRVINQWNGRIKF